LAYSQQVSGSRRGRPGRRHFPRPNQGADRGPHEYDYHFHETPLGLVESYFAESEQYHCTFATRNNPGRLLSESPEPSEPESSDDAAATVVDKDEAGVSTSAKGKKRLSFKKTGSPGQGPTDISDDDDEPNEGQKVDSPCSPRLSGEDTEIDIEEPEGFDRRKPSYIPDDDLFRDRWYPDPWNRAPGEMWTKEIQNRHNLKATVRERGFTGPRAAFLFNQIWKRKGHRFPYNERVSLKMPEQTQTEYTTALKQRREEGFSCENQVNEYDEESALEECKWALDLYEKVYGPDGPDSTLKPKSNIPHIMVNEDGFDDDDEEEEEEEEEEESTPKRRKTRQHTSTPEPSKTKKVPVVNHGITIPPLSQRATPQQIEQRNKDFRAYRAEVIEAAGLEREEEDIEAFLRSELNRKFSNGYRGEVGGLELFNESLERGRRNGILHGKP